MTVVWTRLALADLDSAHDHIAEERPSAALRMVERIEKSIVTVGRHPEIGRTGRVDGTREMVVPGTPFIIAYRVRAKNLELISIIHGARRWPDQF